MWTGHGDTGTQGLRFVIERTDQKMQKTREPDDWTSFNLLCLLFPVFVQVQFFWHTWSLVFDATAEDLAEVLRGDKR